MARLTATRGLHTGGARQVAGRTQRDRDPRTHVLMLLLDTPTPAHPTFASSNVQEAASRGTIKQNAPRERRRQPRDQPGPAAVHLGSARYPLKRLTKSLNSQEKHTERT